MSFWTWMVNQIKSGIGEVAVGMVGFLSFLAVGASVHPLFFALSGLSAIISLHGAYRANREIEEKSPFSMQEKPSVPDIQKKALNRFEEKTSN